MTRTYSQSASGPCRQLYLWLLLGGLIFTLLRGPAAFASDASDVVEAFHAELIEVMQAADDMDFAARRDRLAPSIASLFDSSFMVRAASGAKWKEIDDQEKVQLAAAFEAMTLANYASRFNGYAGQKFETLGEQDVRGGRLYVRTQIIKSDGEAIRINYLLQPRDDQWRIIDIVVKSGISELARRRSEFAPILRDQGFTGLLEVIKNKTAELAADATD